MKSSDDEKNLSNETLRRFLESDFTFAEKRPVAETTKPTALIVDDLPQNLNVLRSILEPRGYTVLAANSGEKAIKRAAMTNPDVILLDILMPGIDGYETCRRLKSIPETKRIPVVLTSALTEMENKVKGFECGAVDYITKPFQREETLARVKSQVKISRLQKALVDANRRLEERVDERTRDLRRALSDLKAAKEEAERVNQIKSSFLANISHELRTPMNGLLGYVDILKEEEDPAERDALVKGVSRSGRRLMRTITSMLELSLLEAGELRATSAPTDVNDLVMKSVRFAKEEAEVKGIEFAVLLSEEPLYAIVDPRLAGQAISAVADNAVKFSPKGGVEIRVRREQRNGDRFALVEVEDDGIGIDPAHRDLIFQDFRQSSEGLSRQYEGAGLGLTLAKRELAMMNGEIDFDSAPGEGSTFRLALPEYLSS
jgi:signal transduction histidine kinase